MSKLSTERWIRLTGYVYVWACANLCVFVCESALVCFYYLTRRHVCNELCEINIDAVDTHGHDIQVLSCIRITGKDKSTLRRGHERFMWCVKLHTLPLRSKERYEEGKRTISCNARTHARTQESTNAHNASTHIGITCKCFPHLYY